MVLLLAVVVVVGAGLAATGGALPHGCVSLPVPAHTTCTMVVSVFLSVDIGLLMHLTRPFCRRRI